MPAVAADETFLQGMKPIGDKIIIDFQADPVDVNSATKEWNYDFACPGNFVITGLSAIKTVDGFTSGRSYPSLLTVGVYRYDGTDEDSGLAQCCFDADTDAHDDDVNVGAKAIAGIPGTSYQSVLPPNKALPYTSILALTTAIDSNDYVKGVAYKIRVKICATPSDDEVEMDPSCLIVAEFAKAPLAGLDTNGIMTQEVITVRA